MPAVSWSREKNSEGRIFENLSFGKRLCRPCRQRVITRGIRARNGGDPKSNGLGTNSISKETFIFWLTGGGADKNCDCNPFNVFILTIMVTIFKLWKKVRRWERRLYEHREQTALKWFVLMTLYLLIDLVVYFTLRLMAANQRRVFMKILPHYWLR